MKMTGQQHDDMNACMRSMDADGRTRMLTWIGGSFAHGLATGSSDLDMRAVMYATADTILLQHDEQPFHHPDYDLVLIPLKCFIAQLLKGGMTALEALNLPDACMITHDCMADDLTMHREMFLSKHLAHTCLKAAQSAIHHRFAYDNDENMERMMLKAGKYYAEAFRLTWTARHIITDNVFLTRLTDGNELDYLRALRSGESMNACDGVIKASNGVSDRLSEEMRITERICNESRLQANLDASAYDYCNQLLHDTNMRTIMNA